MINQGVQAVHRLKRIYTNIKPYFLDHCKKADNQISFFAQSRKTYLKLEPK